jgi:hypothetical protein
VRAGSPFGASRYVKALPAESHTSPQVKPTELGLNQGNKCRKSPRMTRNPQNPQKIQSALAPIINGSELEPIIKTEFLRYV